MNKVSRKRLKTNRISKKNKILKGGNQKYMININFNLQNVDLNKILDPLDLTPEYLDLLLTHLRDLVPSSYDLELEGTFQNEYILNYNYESKYNMTFKIIVNYISEEDDFTLEKIDEFFRLMTDMDAPFTSEDDITYYISHDFDINRDVKILKN